jgi:hypothetical protein
MIEPLATVVSAFLGVRQGVPLEPSPVVSLPDGLM